MSKQPKWTIGLIDEAINKLNNAGYDCNTPPVTWRKPMSRYLDIKTDTVRKRQRKCTSGVCYEKHITICGGSNRVDCKMVILHELAHWAMPMGEHHGSKFWDLAWWLYREFKLPMRYCLNREKGYRKEAVKAYRRSK